MQNMSTISVKNLTFGYDGAADNVFDDISFSFDTGWKLGLIGRNG
jgi:lincosamide and streptogramin A transport system ATP-binding/permease protein